MQHDVQYITIFLFLSPASGGESVPGELKDISPEELRWERMQAQVHGTSDRLDEKVQQLRLDYKVSTHIGGDAETVTM